MNQLAIVVTELNVGVLELPEECEKWGRR
jgi:hypothetical protein